MAEALLFVSQDVFTCSVCLDTLTDPVSLHCGHSFCLKCLTDCWDQSQLNRNTLLNEPVLEEVESNEVVSDLPEKETMESQMMGVTLDKNDSQIIIRDERKHTKERKRETMTNGKDFCPLILDINTAHRDLRLSEGNKKVTCEGTEAKYPDHPDRFDRCVQVLCREALTGTHCYWEVECSADFMRIGVAYKGLGRKEGGWECGLGYNNKSWCLWWSHSKYAVHHNKKGTVIRAPYSPRIGVYLDWPAGSLSFYSVSHTMTLLHRFNTSFTEPLCPGFGFGSPLLLGLSSQSGVCVIIRGGDTSDLQIPV
uniref:Uncharacterized protein n=1 Tax=Erpetoichthys calabaricus TaxID=27687 RepID=A0A8C4RIN6_ERPCA